MVAFPPCKINIGLQIISRRPDGFHNLQTIFYPLPLKDVLELIPAQETRLYLTGLPVKGIPSDNLCMKAYQLIKTDFPDLPSYEIHLHKHIPMGAGLGGGSADAAYMLRLLNQKAGLHLSKTQLSKYAAQLGSDCPFFIENEPCLAEGRGEILHTITANFLQGYYLLLLTPTNIHVNTARAYSLIHPQSGKTNLMQAIKQPPQFWKEQIVNDFEEPVFKLHPTLKDLKEQLYKQGAEYASLSGSGCSLYGLFTYPINVEDFSSGHLVVRSFHL